MSLSEMRTSGHALRASVHLAAGSLLCLAMTSVIAGFPNAVLEAMAAGKPVVASRFGIDRFGRDRMVRETEGLYEELLHVARR
jgi:glycosyltransferase involved in cell wall biosynthesis